MTIIKKIIYWIIELFKSLFGKKKVTKKIKSNINNAKNKHYLKGYGAFLEDSYNETMPVYLLINNEEKQRLIEKVKLIEEKIHKMNDESKDSILSEINKITKEIKDNRISFYQDEQIEDKLNTILNDKSLNVDINKKVTNLHNDIFEIIDHFDKNIKDKVIREYETLNYVTISTILLDDTIKEIKKIEEDYKHHRYNKYYYDRELARIKVRISKLKMIRDSVEIRKEIELLRKDLYIKSKDKYDLLYNEEVFANLENVCDELLNRVNRKVVDIKKSVKKEQKEENKKDKDDKKEQKELELQENIIKRFQDLELARKLILLRKKEKIYLENMTSLINYMNDVYYEFLNGERLFFNFERNKVKTELVKFYNDLGILNATLNKSQFVFLDHINYRMEDLIDISAAKKEELETTLATKLHYVKDKHEESILVNNKLNILKEKELERQNGKDKVYVKVRNGDTKDQK